MSFAVIYFDNYTQIVSEVIYFDNRVYEKLNGIILYQEGNMSLFLIEGSHWTHENEFNMLKGNIPSISQRNSYPRIQQMQEILLKQLRRHNEFTNVFIENTTKGKRFNIILQKIANQIKGVFSILIAKTQQDMVVNMVLLNQNWHHIKSCSPIVLAQLVKNLAFNSNPIDNLKITLHPYNLSIKITLPYFCLGQAIVLDSGERILKSTSIIIELFKQLILPLESKMQKIIPLLQLIEIPSLEQDRFLNNLIKYSKLSTMFYNFSENNQIPLHILQKKKIQFLQSREKIFQRKKNINSSFFNISSLYFFSKIQKQQGVQNFIISQKQKTTLKNFIALPNMNPTRTSQSNIILNYIRLQNPEVLPDNYYNGGGFAQIYQGTVNFWPVDSSDANNFHQKNIIIPNGMIRKNLVLKKPIDGQKSKMKRQIDVIKQMKNGAPIFLPQYYLQVNTKTSDKYQNLLIDFLPFPNLKQYMSMSKSHYSLYIRILTAYWIIGGLRFLKDYKVLHLDLKPANIIKCNNGMIKFIDFGQSHHPSLPFVQPGISQPYTAPELRRKIIQKDPCITFKSDIYSFGVILFELIYNKKPFDKSRKWDFNMEQSQRYGQKSIMHALNWLISKCWNPNPQDRPQLEWIAIILKLCMSKIGLPD